MASCLRVRSSPASNHAAAPAQRGGPLALLRDGGIDVVFAAHVGFEDLHCVTDLMAGALVDGSLRVEGLLRRYAARMSDSGGWSRQQSW